MTKKIIIVRHGQFDNLGHLNEDGKLQINRITKKIKKNILCVVITKGADVLPLGVADLVVEPDHDPAPFALGLETVFLKPPFIPPVNPFAGFFGKSDVVERQGDIKGIQGGSKTLGQACLAKHFGVLPLVGAVDAAKVFFPE